MSAVLDKKIQMESLSNQHKSHKLRAMVNLTIDISFVILPIFISFVILPIFINFQLY